MFVAFSFERSEKTKRRGRKKKQCERKNQLNGINFSTFADDENVKVTGGVRGGLKEKLDIFPLFHLRKI